MVKSNNQRYPFPAMVDQFLNRELSSIFGSDVQHQVPAVNIREDEQAFHVELAAPGLKKEDFTISLEKNVMTIGGQRKQESAETKPNYLKKEFSYHGFKRSFTLPETVNTDAISARYENGVLLVTVPKKEKQPAQGAKTISIA